MLPLTYSIRELADEFSVTTRTIRFYESKGLIAPKRQGQKRIYSRDDRAQLKFILRTKRLGLSLDDIVQLIDLYDLPKNSASDLQHYLELLLKHKFNLLLQKSDLEQTLEELAEAEAECREALREAYRK